MQRPGADHRRRLLQGLSKHNRHRGLYPAVFTTPTGCGSCPSGHLTGIINAVEQNTDILSTSNIFEVSSRRRLVSDTDIGSQLRSQIRTLTLLLEAYRGGLDSSERRLTCARRRICGILSFPALIFQTRTGIQPNKLALCLLD